MFGWFKSRKSSLDIAGWAKDYGRRFAETYERDPAGFVFAMTSHPIIEQRAKDLNVSQLSSREEWELVVALGMSVKRIVEACDKQADATRKPGQYFENFLSYVSYIYEHRAEFDIQEQNFDLLTWIIESVPEEFKQARDKEPFVNVHEIVEQFQVGAFRRAGELNSQLKDAWLASRSKTSGH